MAILSEESCYHRQSMSKRFSVRKAETGAIKVAKIVAPLICSGEPDRRNSLASLLAENTRMTWFRAIQMLQGLGKLSTPADALRVGFAVYNYPEYFSDSDTQADPPYLGDPVFPVHGRIIDCCVSQIRGREIVLMKFLAMSSIFAGRVYKLYSSPYIADKIIRKVYSGKSASPYVSLSGCYIWLESNLLFREIGKRDLTDGLGVNTEERSINKDLYKARGDVDCIKACSEPKGVNCYACLVPRGECRLSTREKRKNDVQTEIGGVDSEDDGKTLVGAVDSDQGPVKNS